MIFYFASMLRVKFWIKRKIREVHRDHFSLLRSFFQLARAVSRSVSSIWKQKHVRRFIRVSIFIRCSAFLINRYIFVICIITRFTIHTFKRVNAQFERGENPFEKSFDVFIWKLHNNKHNITEIRNQEVKTRRMLCVCRIYHNSW